MFSLYNAWLFYQWHHIFRSLVADSGSSHSPRQGLVADDEKRAAFNTPLRSFKAAAMHESHGRPRTESLSQSGAAATEVQLLNGEIVYLRQRLQMEVLANQELEQVPLRGDDSCVTF
jgi:hypothetical protein